MTNSPRQRSESPSSNPNATKKARTEATNYNEDSDYPITSTTRNGSAPDSQISHTTALEYWGSTSATVDGMLGGYPQVSRTDLQGSSNFLAKLRRTSKTHGPGKKLRRVVDCGAGIGRITLGFLSKVAEVVDVVEPVEKFTREITEGDEFAEIRARGGIGKVWNVGLEGWRPEVPELEASGGKYDVIWTQWCAGQLTDGQLVEYLRRTQGYVVQGGWIVVKENLSNHHLGEDVYDETDSSVTRTDDKFRGLFKKAGLKLVSTEMQKGFPKGLYPVRIYALQPTG